MTQPFTLRPLMNLAQTQSETATRKLGQLNRKEVDAQNKLETLQHYRSDYQTRLQEATQQGMSPSELRNFQEFINKLDAAIAQQTQVVQQSKMSTQQGRSEFTDTQRKLKSFDTLLQRHIEVQNQIAAKTEQKDLDEHTGRYAAYKMLKPENPEG